MYVSVVCCDQFALGLIALSGKVTQLLQKCVRKFLKIRCPIPNLGAPNFGAPSFTDTLVPFNSEQYDQVQNDHNARVVKLIHICFNAELALYKQTLNS